MARVGVFGAFSIFLDFLDRLPPLLAAGRALAAAHSALFSRIVVIFSTDGIAWYRFALRSYAPNGYVLAISELEGGFAALHAI
jgi:hypothetical protein